MIAIELAYLAAACLFILGIKGLSKPKTAVRGNTMAATGMLIAILATLLHQDVVGYGWIFAGLLVGGALGALGAKKVEMTEIPQMVALLNGFGGGASLAVALAEFSRGVDFPDPTVTTIAQAAIGFAILIGGVTLSGSLVAFGKLHEIIKDDTFKLPAATPLNMGLLGLGLLMLIWLAASGSTLPVIVLVVIAILLGLLLVNPIGGADMPVVIALLNSYSGIAAAAAGFVTGNSVLIVSGSLVGASGLVLTRIMCKAMNRSLPNVLFGKMAEGGEIIDADEVYAGKVKSSSPEEVAMMLETAQRVVIVPGFGLAMAQAQHAVRDLADCMEANGTLVEYAIHPVAGRMPGHMNVLLAEAEVPYDKLKEMEVINPTFEQTDVAIVIGANDVTNPMAREDKGSPIYGMPILNVDKARTVVVVKRSLSPGFAGLPNPLFAKDNTLMLFGDGKQALLDLIAALKDS
jgi:NAD(P) transhydrogenase subunit beta